MPAAERFEEREQQVFAKLRAGPRVEGQHVTDAIYCLPGDQVVSARGITAATMRKYEGEIVSIETASGDRLTVTQNHPVLTRRGWVAAGLLNESDQIARGRFGEGLLATQAYDVYVPTGIGEVFRALNDAGSSLTDHARGGRDDFHGDGADGKVDIVLADGLLPNARQSGLLNADDNGFLSGCNCRQITLPRQGGFLQDFGAVRPAAIRRLSGESSNRLSLSHPPILVGSGVSEAAERESTCAEVVAKVRAGEADTLGDFMRRFPGQVSLVQISKIHRRSYSGHVYNLTTQGGFYLHGNIPVANCNVKAWAVARLGATGEAPAYDDTTLLRFLMGHGMAGVLEEGEVSQIETVAPDSADVGTIDIWLRDHPVEIKVTSVSMRREVTDMAHWLEQLGEYTWRSTKRPGQPGAPRYPWGELWASHLLGDYGKKFCPEHGVPDEPAHAVHPETNRKRLVCPECREFLSDGDRDTMLRCWRIVWTWEELDSLHEIHAWRQRQLQEDIENAEFAIGAPPPIRYGYQREFECRKCPVKERIGCPGIDGEPSDQDLEELLQGSINQITKEEVPA